MLVTVFVDFLGALTGNMTEVTYKIEGLFVLWDTVCHVEKVMEAGWGGSWLHSIHSQKGERDKDWCPIL